MAKIIGDRWEIIKPINEGGQAHIYLVQDLKIQDDKKYILKRLKNKKRKDRFEREIEALKNLESPYIERIIDYDITQEKDFYFVMPFYTEKTLENILSELKSKFLRCLRIFKKICEGIKVAHGYNPPIIHRDLKPLNILIDNKDSPKIIDFGLCFLEGQERLTFSQEQVGSRFYMAPECEIGESEKIGAHSDIYSLGKVLYAMISGGRIFPRERQNEDEFNLEKIIIDRRTRYATKIINKCVKETISERFNNIDDLIHLTNEIIKLLEDGFFPVKYGDEFCRFCGQGKLVRFGKLRGSILKRGNMQEDISPHEMILWGCPNCGITYLFKDDIYQEHKN